MKPINWFILVLFLFPNNLFGQNEFEISQRIQDSLQEFFNALSYVNDEEEPILPSSIAKEYGNGNYFVFNGREMKLEHFIEDYCYFDLQRHVVNHTLTFPEKIVKTSNNNFDNRWSVSAILKREYASGAKMKIANEKLSVTVQWRGMDEPIRLLDITFQSQPRSSNTIVANHSSDSKPLLQTDIFYAAREVVVTDSERGKVENVINCLKANPEFKVEVTGYTDSSEGNPRINMYYSKARAEGVAKALIDAGIDAARISVDAKGDAVQYTDGYDMNRVTIVIRKYN